MQPESNIKGIKQGVFLLLFLFAAVGSWAQGSQVTSNLDTNQIFIGDQVRLTLEVETSSPQIVKFPILTDTLTGSIEVIETPLLDTTLLEDGAQRLAQSYVLTSFDSGTQVTPPLPVIVNGDTQFSKSLQFEVFSVKVDTTKAFKTIKGPVEVGYGFWEIAGPIILILIGILLIIGIILLIRKLSQKKDSGPVAPIEPPKPIIPPHIVALEAFKNLRSQGLWQKGEIKKYHSELTEILRTYIEGRFNIPALEKTSDEVLQSFRNRGLTSEVPFMELKQILALSDLVKFAKAKPFSEENEQSLENAIRFVTDTIQQVPEKEEKENSALETNENAE